jgi:hypothetical protein
MKYLIIMTVLLSSCAGMMLKELDTKSRKTSVIKPTKLSKNQAFDSTLSFLAKRIGNSNHAIRLKDKKTGKIIAKIGYDCVGLKRPDVITNISSTFVDYVVEISIKNKKIRIQLLMEGFQRTIGIQGNTNYFIAQDKGQESSVKKCSNDLISMIMAGLSSESQSNDW